MDELKLSPVIAAARPKNSSLWLASLQVGQVLRMTVADKPSSGTLLLRAGTHQFTAISDAPVGKGAVLTLEVSSLSPAPSLKIINLPAPGAVQVDPLDGYLKLLMPSQGRVIAPLLALLDPARNANILSQLGLSRGELDRNYKVLSRHELLADSGALKRAVQQSGLFFESQLLALLDSGNMLPSGDLKAALLKLLARVNRVLPPTRGDTGAEPEPEKVAMLTLRDELEGALSTITLKQLAAWRADGKAWSFDIPFRIDDAVYGVALRIEREPTHAGAKPDPEDTDWKILINVTLPTLGDVTAELFLRAEKVSVVLYVQQDDTAQLMNGSLHQLKSSLEGRGLNVSVLRCHQGQRDKDNVSVPAYPCVDEDA